MKIIIVGINPTKKEHMKNNTMNRLKRWMNSIGIDEYNFTNCIFTLGKYKKEMINYETLKKNVSGFDKVLALGKFVSDALIKINIDHFKIPHPSGLNRQTNDKEFINEELKKCKSYVLGEIK